MLMGLPDATDEVRTKPAGDRQRQAFPCGDHQAIFGIERVVLRNGLAGLQPEPVGEGGRREAPVLLKGVGACALLTAAEIEQGGAPCRGPAHDIPVHVVIGMAIPRCGHTAAIIGQDLVTPVEVQHTRYRLLTVIDECCVSGAGKRPHQPFEPAMRENWASEIAHAFSIDPMQTFGILASLSTQATFDALAQNRPLLPGDRFEVSILVRTDLLSECRVKIASLGPCILIGKPSLWCRVKTA
jgi:hypothetical protein